MLLIRKTRLDKTIKYFNGNHVRSLGEKINVCKYRKQYGFLKKKLKNLVFLRAYIFGMKVVENLRDAFNKIKNKQRPIYFLLIAMCQIIWALYLHTFFETECLVRVSFSNERLVASNK